MPVASDLLPITQLCTSGFWTSQSASRKQSLGLSHPCSPLPAPSVLPTMILPRYFGASRWMRALPPRLPACPVRLCLASCQLCLPLARVPRPRFPGAVSSVSSFCTWAGGEGTDLAHPLLPTARVFRAAHTAEGGGGGGQSGMTRNRPGASSRTASSGSEPGDSPAQDRAALVPGHFPSPSPSPEMASDHG